MRGRAKACVALERSRALSVTHSLFFSTIVFSYDRLLAAAIACFRSSILKIQRVAFSQFFSFNSMLFFVVWAVTVRRRTMSCSIADVIASAPAGSAALEHYLTNVYGEGTSDSSTWNWERVDVIWLCYLPQELRRRCKWPASPQGSGSLYIQGDDTSRPQGWLWRYPHSTYCRCCGMAHSEAFKDLNCHPDMGGTRRPPTWQGWRRWSGGVAGWNRSATRAAI